MKLTRSTTIALAVAGVLATLPGAIHAQVVTYNTRSIFLSAISGATTVGFSGPAPGAFTSEYSNGGTASVGGLTFTSPSPNALSLYNTQGTSIDLNTGTMQVLMANAGGTDGLETLTIGLGAMEKAFAFDFGAFENEVFTYALSNGQTGSFTNSSTTALSFFGITSATAFNSVTIRVTSPVTAYDNITFAPTVTGVTATPEPATVGLVATGLIGLAGFVRKRKQIA